MNVDGQGIFHGIRLSASGLRAEMQRLKVAAANIANVHTTRTPEGGPYIPRAAVLAETTRFGSSLQQALRNPRLLGGVEVASIAPIPGLQPRLAHDPHHPDAGPDGMVAYPAIDIPMEMVAVMSASRAYEANMAALEAAKHMMDRALEI